MLNTLSFSPEIDSFERADVEDVSSRGLPNPDDFNNFRYPTNQDQDQDQVLTLTPDCSAKIFEALKRCYRQPGPEMIYTRGKINPGLVL